MEDQKLLEARYPSVPLAYELGIKAYDWIFRRSEVMDDKIEKLLAWATGINLALFAMAVNMSARTGSPSFNSRWFYGSGFLLAVGILSGMYAKLKGSLEIASPTQLYQGWLHQSEWEFKKNALFRASEAYEHNRQLVNTKGRFATIASLAFLVEVITLALWFIQLHD